MTHTVLSETTNFNCYLHILKKIKKYFVRKSIPSFRQKNMNYEGKKLILVFIS